MTIAALRRVTTRYISEEDRLLISGEAAQGRIVLMWLTCRMTRQLVVHLAGILTPASEVTPDVARGQSLAQEMSQESAMARLGSQAPVTSNVELVQTLRAEREQRAAIPLIRTVEVKRSAQNVAVVFCERDRESAVAQLQLTATPLRQWLGILHRQFRAADWPTTDWPAWLTEATDRSVLPAQIH